MIPGKNPIMLTLPDMTVDQFYQFIGKVKTSYFRSDYYCSLEDDYEHTPGTMYATIVIYYDGEEYFRYHLSTKIIDADN